jgi:tetrahydromethanopterin S-methyltransferase subunit G
MSQYELIIKMLNDRFDRLENKLDSTDKKVEKIRQQSIRRIGFSAGVVAVFSVVGFVLQLFIAR